MPARSNAYRVAIYMNDDALARRVVESLDSDEFELIRAAEMGADVDVMVSDSVGPAHSATSNTAATRLFLGVDKHGDANLPRNASADTIRTTIALLGRIARLERSLVETDRRRERVEHEASIDPLTSVANRRAWDAALERVRDSNTGHYCVAIVDLDLFKSVNTQHGHMTGDRVLATFAQAMASAVRTTDVVARLGGDEFALLMSGLSRDQAMMVLERVRQQARDAFAAAGLPAVTASIGLAMSTNLADADRALRLAKEQGRDRVVAAPHPS